MAKLNSVNLGELYKELRTARGIKMKDVVNSNLSQSQLSKFENGLTMLSADKLLIAISAIHMSFAEFEHAYNLYQDSSFFILANKLSELHEKKDVDGLEKLLRDYDRDSEIYDIYNQLNQLVIKCAIGDIKSEDLVSDKEKELITDYLYSIEAWTEYELYIFGNTLQVLSDSDLVFLSKAFIERDAVYLNIPNNRYRTQLVIINIIFVLLERNQMYYADFFMNHLEKIINYQDMFAKTILLYFRKVLNYKEGKLQDKNSITSYINIIKDLGFEEIAEILSDSIGKLI